jgi:hypothetical protein
MASSPRNPLAVARCPPKWKTGLGWRKADGAVVCSEPQPRNSLLFLLYCPFHPFSHYQQQKTSRPFHQITYFVYFSVDVFIKSTVSSKDKSGKAVQPIAPAGKFCGFAPILFLDKTLPDAYAAALPCRNNFV